MKWPALSHTPLTNMNGTQIVWEWWTERNPVPSTATNMGDAPTLLEIMGDADRIDISKHTSAYWPPYADSTFHHAPVENDSDRNTLDDMTSTLAGSSTSTHNLVNDDERF